MSRLAHVFSVGLIPFCCFLAIPTLATAQDWIEVQSPNFRVVSNQGTRAARQVALEFERIRAVLRTVLPDAVADPLRPLVVVAVGDEGDLVALAPEYQDGPRPGGFFQSGQYMHHIVLLIEQGPAAIYHEYFHLLTRLSARRLPIWLREGLAEFYSNVDLSSSAAKIGQADDAALAYLGRRSLVPLRTLLARTTNPHQGDPDEIRVFYAQSWTLTHFLMVGQDDPATGQQALARYMTLVSQGTDPVAAFEQTIGSIEEFDRRLREYRRQLAFDEFVIETGDDINDVAFVTRKLSQTEALALRANVLTEGGNPDAAGPFLEEAEAFGESSSVLAEANGLFHLRLGRQEEAEGWFAEAIRLGSTSYIPYYLQAQAEDTATRIEHLRQATTYNPRYAPAYAELARLYANDSVFNEAMPLAGRAVELNTGEAFYWILLGQILLHRDQPDAARVVAQRGLTSAPDPEAQKDLTAFVGEIDEYMAARAEPQASATEGIRPEADRTVAQGQDGEHEGQQPGATIQFDTKGVEFGPWLKRFVAQVRRNWFVPQAAMVFSGHVVLQFNIHRDGAITDIVVAQPSHIDAFDNAAYGAIVKSNPTAPLPPEYPSEQAMFTVTFYNNESPPSR